ncbi:protein-disulfide reductase DsbD family protein [Roseibacillus ishigakijimensis]|uniref:Thioredoxin family protein n=1 Tax=Roseibacillus ishigakijimensis TaxID=454146 RepID=A0A934VL08_9BACT|nr:thioredoxin family protein [Roseibacillus ishigakijimensis]MBK1834199.1 thioredoxin family protein [Roseibacillus ishigakijimensis]
MKPLALFLILVLSSFFPALAQDFDPFESFGVPTEAKKEETQASLLAEVNSIAPGEPFTVALKLEHPAGWHSYYVNTGLIGEVLQSEWTLPEGFQADYLGWPTPHLSKSFGYQSIGYEGTVYHLYRITPPKSLSPGDSVDLTLAANWQICDDSGCVPENTTQTLTLTSGAEATPNQAVAAEFATARAHYPNEEHSLEITASEANDVITLTIPSAGELQAENLHFFDEDGQVSVQEPHTAKREGETITLTLPRNLGNDFAEAGPVEDRLAGILTDGTTSYLVDVPFSEPEVAATPVSLSSLLPILGGMFLGGLILNLMPCVFPVIGIKIMGFVNQAGHDRKKIMLHGLAFAGGVFASFWLLALIMTLGGIKNWGGQLENPYVMFTLIVVMLLLAMNMYGVFEIGVGATGVGSNLTRKEGLGGSFFSGILATVVATPCSAPFLGAALGAAVALPTFWFFFAFTVMAAGLSLPYLMLSAFPDLVKKLPKPGAWMESFKQGMSFLLFATVGYLLWVYSAQVFEQDYGQKGLFVMIGLALIAAAGWVWGRWTTPVRKPRVQWTARTITLLLFATGIIIAKPSKEASTTNEVAIDWQPWSKEKEQELLAAGTPVYIDFTAKWCLTCQVNKKNAYTQEVVDLMKERDIVFLKADKTTTNPEIDTELKRLGRSAIPVNVLYVPGKREPHITPEVLNPGIMKNLIEEQLGEAPPANANTAAAASSSPSCLISLASVPQ